MPDIVAVMSVGVAVRESEFLSKEQARDIRALHLGFHRSKTDLVEGKVDNALNYCRCHTSPLEFPFDDVENLSAGVSDVFVLADLGQSGQASETLVDIYPPEVAI